LSKPILLNLSEFLDLFSINCYNISMNVRESMLPPGWYPREKSRIEGFLKDFKMDGKAKAAIAPHAGWFYSGYPAALSVSALDPAVETIVVIGGHLSQASPFLFAPEDGVRTPLGILEIDRELREDFAGKLESAPDKYRDNTVEILLPMIKYFFPKAKLLWARFPQDLRSFDAGKILADCVAGPGRNIAVLSSTDLTHYGSNYGFAPKGQGKKALDWVKNTNDAAFIKAVLSGDKNEILARAENDFSACSAGAVLGAVGFVSQSPNYRGELLDYRTSADAPDGASDLEIPDSFVGYASIAFVTYKK
jgi:AmmeMemoRadiSam system protein B